MCYVGGHLLEIDEAKQVELDQTFSKPIRELSAFGSGKELSNWQNLVFDVLKALFGEASGHSYFGDHLMFIDDFEEILQKRRASEMFNEKHKFERRIRSSISSVVNSMIRPKSKEKRDSCPTSISAKHSGFGKVMWMRRLKS